MLEPVQVFADALKMVLSGMTGETGGGDFNEIVSCMPCEEPVSGIMRLKNKRGWIRIVMEKSTGIEIVERMLGCPEHGLSQSELEDGVVEFLNVVAGMAKAALAGGPYYFELAVPSYEHDFEPGVPPDGATYMVARFPLGDICLGFLIR